MKYFTLIELLQIAVPTYTCYAVASTIFTIIHVPTAYIGEPVYSLYVYYVCVSTKDVARGMEFQGSDHPSKKIILTF